MTKPVLAAINLNAGYQQQVLVRALNLHVNHGEMVCLLGPNGAGKTTTLQTLAGSLKPISGNVHLYGQCCRAPLHQRVRQGLAYISDERSVIMSLSAADNLRLRGGSISAACAYFPELTPLLNRPAALLSGGQQQLLAVARALAAKPNIIIADELSMGLAPQIVERLLQALRKATQQGLAVLLVEQHIDQALAYSDRAYVMRHGRVVLHGTSADLQQQRDAIERAYISQTPA